MTHSILTPIPNRKPKIDYIQLPEKVKDTVSESEIYSILLNYEHRLDTLLAEKKQHMRQLLLKNETSKEILRIYVTHQRRPISKTEEEWRIGIQGGIVRTSNNNHIADHYKFTNFLKSMIIELDRTVFTGEDIIEWTNNGASKDGFTFSRKVNPQKVSETYTTNYPMKVLFHIKQDPPLYEVSANLMQIISQSDEYQAHNNASSMHSPTEFTLNQILSMIWEYISKNHLYDSEDKSIIVLDEKLREVIGGGEKASYVEILKKIKSHLTIPMNNTVIEIEHLISLDTSVNTGSSKKDVAVQTPIPNNSKSNASIEKILSEEPNGEIEAINKNIQGVIQEIKQHAEKLKFMKKFAEDPINTVHALIDSQTRDLLIVHKKQSIEEARKSTFYKPCDWVNSALTKYLGSLEEKNKFNTQFH